MSSAAGNRAVWAALGVMNAAFAAAAVTNNMSAWALMSGVCLGFCIMGFVEDIR